MTAKTWILPALIATLVLGFLHPQPGRTDDEPGIVGTIAFTVISPLLLPGMGISWTSGTTLFWKGSREEVMTKISEDAAAFMAGQPASPPLGAVIEKTRDLAHTLYDKTEQMWSTEVANQFTDRKIVRSLVGEIAKMRRGDRATR